jgi:hypothetical protein
MAETPSTNPAANVLPSMRTRRNFVIATMLFTWAIIVFVLLRGEASNSLHSSALAWAFATNAAIIGAFIFGVGWDHYVAQSTRTP